MIWAVKDETTGTSWCEGQRTVPTLLGGEMEGVSDRRERRRRGKDEPQVQRIDTREEDGSVDTSNGIRDQLSIDFEGY